MKKTLFLSFVAMLGFTQAVAQEYEYVPFVREGVKWVYCIDNSYDEAFSETYLPIPAGTSYYSFEMKGEAEFDGKHYKPVILYYIDEAGKEIAQEIIPVYLREEDKVVYAYHPDGMTYLQCPVGYGGFADYNGWTSFFYPMDYFNNEEFILYDFNHPETFYQPLVNYLGQGGFDYMAYLRTDFVAIGEHSCKQHSYKGYGDTENVIIEGIGCNGIGCMPLCYFPILTTGMDIGYWLSHVIENGEIVYKGERYREPQANPIPGDYNDDNLVNISDVTTLINMLLRGGESNNIHDMNGDGKLSISDVTDLINFLLAGH